MRQIPLCLFLEPPGDKDKEQRDEDQVDKRGGEHTATDGRTNGVHGPGSGPGGEGQRQHAEEKGQRRHHNGAKPGFHRAKHRVNKGFAMVDAVPTQQEPAPLQLTVDRERLQSLSPLQRAAVLTTHGAQEQIEAISRSLFDCLLTIKNPRRAKTLPPGNPAPCVTRRPDPDSFAAGIRVLVGVWLSALAWIFFDPPGHIMFIVFTGVHSLIGIMTPQMDWRKFFLANATGVFFTGLLYVFVLPSLSGYLGLPLLLFSFTAVIYYIFWDPRAMMLRFAGIIPFVMLTNLQNHQTYDFVTFANNGAGMPAIRTPTLIMHAAQDDVTSLWNVHYLQKHLAGPIETILLDNCFHMITVDQQCQDVVTHTARFFQSLGVVRRSEEPDDCIVQQCAADL